MDQDKGQWTLCIQTFCNSFLHVYFNCIIFKIGLYIYTAELTGTIAINILLKSKLNTPVPLGHDRTTICEKNANFDDRGTIV